MMKRKNNLEIEKLRQQVIDLEFGWKRTQADFENYRKRTEQDRINLCTTANLDLIVKILPVLDNFRRASLHIPENLQENDWTKGILMIEKHLEDILIQEGLIKIAVKPGHQFDPNLHEAISYEENKDFKSEQIITSVEEGYKLGDKIIRPAKVRVAK